MDQALVERTEQFLKDTFSNSVYLQAHPTDWEYRIQHSYRVANLAKYIAQQEGLDVTDAVIAGLLHDIAYWELLYKGWFIPPTTLHRLTVHLWQSDNQQRERRHICNGAWHGGKCPCPVLFTFPTNGNCFALFIGTVSFQIYDKGCNPNHCTEDIKNKLKHGVVICLIDNLKDYSNSPNYGTRSKNSYS